MRKYRLVTAPKYYVFTLRRIQNFHYLYRDSTSRLTTRTQISIPALHLKTDHTIEEKDGRKADLGFSQNSHLSPPHDVQDITSKQISDYYGVKGSGTGWPSIFFQ